MKRVVKIISIIMFFFPLVFINCIFGKIFFVLLSSLLFITIRLWEEYKIHISSINPNFLDNLDRNYEILELGILKELESNINILKLMNYRRNLYTDVLLIKRYYSLLRIEGIVRIHVEKTREYLCRKTISVFDYALLHPMTLYEHNIFLYFYVIKLKEIFSGILFFIYVRYEKGNNSVDNKVIENALDSFNDIAKFLNERSMWLEIDLPNKEMYEEIQNAKNRLQKNIILKY